MYYALNAFARNILYNKNSIKIPINAACREKSGVKKNVDVHKILKLKEHIPLHKMTTHIVFIHIKVEQLNFKWVLNVNVKCVVVRCILKFMLQKRAFAIIGCVSNLMSLTSCVCSRSKHTSGLIILNQGALKHIRYRFICHVTTAFGNRIDRIWTKQRMTFKFWIYMACKVT